MKEKQFIMWICWGMAMMDLLFCPAQAQAQKPTVKERIVITLGAGAGELYRTFGDDQHQWSTYFNYRFGVGYRFSKRLDAGIGVSNIALSANNGWAFPNGNGGFTYHQPTKGESLGLLSFYAKFIPVAKLTRLSVQVDFGLAAYNDIEHSEYARTGAGYCLTLAYNLLNQPGVRIEPYLSYEASQFNDKTVNGIRETGWAYRNVTLGVALVLTKDNGRW